jgi:hypothetical protein
VPLMVQYGQKAAEGDDELREYALQVGCLNQRFNVMFCCRQLAMIHAWSMPVVIIQYLG